jgi:hypothetical protein
MATTRWTRQHVSAIVDDPSTSTPVIDDAPDRLLPDTDFWDLWPIRVPDGTVATPCGAQIWAGLSAPAWATRNSATTRPASAW